MTHASWGMVASLLTALITPRETMTVAFSKRGPETGTTVAPRMAKHCGSPPRTSALSAPPKTAPTAAVTPSANLTLCNVERIHDSLHLDRTGGPIQPPTSRETTRGSRNVAKV